MPAGALAKRRRTLARLSGRVKNLSRTNSEDGDSTRANERVTDFSRNPPVSDHRHRALLPQKAVLRLATAAELTWAIYRR
jgi:hypothetical protein